MTQKLDLLANEIMLHDKLAENWKAKKIKIWGKSEKRY